MTNERAREIEQRLNDYHRDRTTVPYAYYPEEIPAVRAMSDHALEDIRDLLAERERLRAVLSEIQFSFCCELGGGKQEVARRALEE